jgi:glycogen synthase
LKILIISPTFPPRNFGGVTEASYNLAKNLQMRGHNVTVYTTDAGNDSKSKLSVRNKEEFDGLKIRYFKNFSNSIAFKHQIYLPKGMRRISRF